LLENERGDADQNTGIRQLEGSRDVRETGGASRILAATMRPSARGSLGGQFALCRYCDPDVLVEQSYHRGTAAPRFLRQALDGKPDLFSTT